MRTIAAFLVAAYHFLLFNSSEGPLFQGLNESQWFFKLLSTVVLVFFVLTAIVIPLHLEQNNYRLRYYPVFLLKRLVRMHIPFIATIVLTLFIQALFSLKNGQTLQIDSHQFWANLTLTAEFSHTPWYNTIFWTLAIELQFYLVAGLLFPLIIRYKLIAVAGIFVTGEIVCFLFPDSRFIWYYTPCLSIGFLLYLRMTGRAKNTDLIIGTLLIAGITCVVNAPLTAGILITVPLVFLLVRKPPQLLNKPGILSYSFYLTHGITGGSFLYLTRHWNQHFEFAFLRFAGAVLLSYMVAWCFYRMIERPSMKWAQCIRYPKN